MQKKAKSMIKLTKSLAAKAVGVAVREVFAYKAYDKEVIVVTVDGRKLRGHLPEHEE